MLLVVNDEDIDSRAQREAFKSELNTISTLSSAGGFRRRNKKKF